MEFTQLDPGTLTERQRTILKLIVQEYVASGRPVGSKTLTERYPIGVSPATIRNEMVELELERFGLTPVAHKDVDALSSGQRKRLGLARVAVQERPVVVLDEPRSHLDDGAGALIDDFLSACTSRSAAVIVASHNQTDVALATSRLDLAFASTSRHTVVCKEHS